MSAQRYPEDFDGIIAGAPAYNQIYISAWRMRLLMTALKSPQHALPAEKLKLLNDAVLDKCDRNDSLRDRLIEDTRNCNFDPSVLKCNGTETESCLTPQQLETVNAAYTDQDALAQQRIAHCFGFSVGRGELLVTYQFDTDNQAESANLSDQQVLLLDLAQPLHRVFAGLSSACRQLLILKELNVGQRRGAGNRVSTER